MMLWLLLACLGEKESVDSACDRYAEIEGEVAPGWTAEGGCEVTCAALDGEGRAYANCYLTTEGEPMCQYGEPCR